MQAVLRCGLSGVVIVLSVSIGLAGEPKRPIYTDPEAAGADFQIQGEYEGTIGNQTKLGIQVIALGDGQFEAYFLAKGLPGAGWDGKTRVKLTGATKDGRTTFSGKNIRGEIRDGVFTGTAEEDVAFRAKKVHRKSPTLGAKPPEGAIVLFDGKDTSEWLDAVLDGDLLAPPPRPKRLRTKRSFRDFTLHLEFRTPFMPYHRGQARGNSGMYLLDQYEVQILDSFGLTGESNECGGIYKIAKPKVNMCLPPLSWQTYDVEFRAARFDEQGKKTANAVVTIRHNGVVIHEKLVLPGPTPGGGRNDERPGPLYLQSHGPAPGDPVRFRNIWIVEHGS